MSTPPKLTVMEAIAATEEAIKFYLRKKAPLEVSRNARFAHVADSDSGDRKKPVRRVVRHVETGTLWACEYASVLAQATWYEVEAYEREDKQVDYRRRNKKETGR